MTSQKIDLRSDTVTLPSAAMRKAMHDAELGDDVIDIDPTVERLQQVVAERLGKEAAIFMPSGTMTNQVAIRVHCRPGDELICEEGCHIYNYEQGAFAQFSGVVARTVVGNESVMTLDQLRGLIRPSNEHMVRTRMVCIENTHNRGGGRVMPYETVAEITQWAGEHGLIRHLDGARLFNAVVATGIEADQWAQHFDTVSICFSKGLGAPVGSALAGTKEQIAEARRQRKVFGGGMRQAGVIASAALFALENNVDRLSEDHEAASLIAEAVTAAPGLSLEPQQVDTNIVIFRVDPEVASASAFVDALNEVGVSTLPFSDVHVRAVTHLHITQEDAQQAGARIQQVAEQLASVSKAG